MKFAKKSLKNVESSNIWEQQSCNHKEIPDIKIDECLQLFSSKLFVFALHVCEMVFFKGGV
jgi:hypothetical protein